MVEEALEKYQNLGLRESFSLSYRYPMVCRELGVFLRLGFSKSPKPLQSLLFEDTIAAFRLLPQMQTQTAVSAANFLNQSAEAVLPKQKRVLAATEFKQAKVAYKRRFKTQQEDKDISELPKDVLIHLFRFLDLQAIVSAGMVCSLWNEAAKDNYLWQFHFNTHFGDSKSILKMVGVQGSNDVCEDAKYDWREAFRKAYLGLRSWRYKYNRGYCGHCRSIVWLKNMRCSNTHSGQGSGNQHLKPVSPRQLVSYILDDSITNASNSDSESDEEVGLKFWTFRY